MTAGACEPVCAVKVCACVPVVTCVQARPEHLDGLVRRHHRCTWMGSCTGAALRSAPYAVLPGNMPGSEACFLPVQCPCAVLPGKTARFRGLLPPCAVLPVLCSLGNTPRFRGPPPPCAVLPVRCSLGKTAMFRGPPPPCAVLHVRCSLSKTAMFRGPL